MYQKVKNQFQKNGNVGVFLEINCQISRWGCIRLNATKPKAKSD